LGNDISFITCAGYWWLCGFLRLYPMYWVVCIMSLVLIVILGAEYAHNYKSDLVIPADLSSIFFNFTMIFPALFPGDITPRLSPPTWALTIEICFYILIALGVSKTYKRTLLWLAISIIYFAATYLFSLGGAHRYSSIFAASLPFALGALLFFNKQQLFLFLQRIKFSNPWLLSAIYIANAFFFTMNSYYKPFDVSGALGDLGMYLNIVLSVFMVVVLFYRGKELCSKKIDKFIGDFSYPVYLLHWQAGLLVSFILYQTPSRTLDMAGLTTFALATVFVVLFSYGLILLVDNSVSNIRNKIRANSQKQV
jgi:peptidoglycan/LPS O-acetylase OafA/YrhL